MKEKVNAIYSEELGRFLEENGELVKLLNGELFCRICDNALDIDSIQLIIPSKKSGFSYVCNRPDCIEKYYDKQ